MATSFSYSCKDYPGMEACPGHLVAGTRDEVWNLMELHARDAHGEDPGAWSEGDRKYLATLIKAA